MTSTIRWWYLCMWSLSTSAILGWYAAKMIPIPPITRLSFPGEADDMFDILLYHSPDPLMLQIQVWQRLQTNKPERGLEFGGVSDSVHSIMAVNDPFSLDTDYLAVVASTLVLIDDFTSPRLCLIGLGGGTFPKFLSRLLASEGMGILEVVEISYHVYRVARDYFFYDSRHPAGNLKTYVMDGANFLVDSHEEYDWIGLDAYDQHHGPVPFLLDDEFIVTLYDALKPGGVAAINVYDATLTQFYSYKRMFGDGQGASMYVSDDQHVIVLVKPPVKLSASHFAMMWRRRRREWFSRLELRYYIKSLRPF